MLPMVVAQSSFEGVAMLCTSGFMFDRPHVMFAKINGPVCATST